MHSAEVGRRSFRAGGCRRLGAGGSAHPAGKHSRFFARPVSGGRAVRAERRWSNPATWQGGQVPTANHVVRIVLGHTVTIDDTSAVAYTIAVDGKLAFAPTVNTRLKVTNLQVMAGEMGMGTPGVLEVGTAAAPIAAGVTAEIVIANSPLGGSVADPEQFGTGIIVLRQG